MHMGYGYVLEKLHERMQKTFQKLVDNRPKLIYRKHKRPLEFVLCENSFPKSFCYSGETAQISYLSEHTIPGI